MSQSLPVTPSFVGRGDELRQLQSTLAAVQDNGASRCVLLRGDAGIGKSRLIAEIQTTVVESGFAALCGRCFDQERSFPYAPLIDMLRSHASDGAFLEQIQSLGPLSQPLVRLLPELAPYLSDPQSPSLLETDVEKRRLFAALTALILRHAQDGPLLIVVEDLHWSDEASLEFLLYLVRRLNRHPILVLLSARGMASGAAWTELLSGLDRQQGAQEIGLQPLSRAEIAHLLKALLDQPHPPSDEFVDALYALCEGNPFFAEEICASLVASGDLFYAEDHWRRKPLSQLQIPDSLQRLVQQRVERVSPPARQLINLAAVSGRSFDVPVLRALTNNDDDQILELLKELIAARLVVEESADRFAFRHALTREALYSRLLARERQILHTQLVQAIERVHGIALAGSAGERDVHAGHSQTSGEIRVEHPLEANLHVPVETLAYHTFEAGLWRQALSYAREAGERALALDAPHAAAEQLTRAIRAAEHLALPPSASLHRLRGRAFDTQGSFDRAREDYETALSAARDAADQHTTWQILMDLALLWASRDYQRTGDYCRQALDLARTMEDPASIAHTLNRLGNWTMNSGQPFRALDFHREALDLFQDLDDRAGIAATFDLLAMTSNMCGEFEDTVNYYEQAIPILRQLNDRQTLASSLTMLSLYTLNEAMAREALDLARDIGWRAGEAYALQYLGSLLAYEGQYGPGLHYARQGLELAQTIDHHLWQAWGHIVLGTIHIELLSLEPALRHLQTALETATDVGSSFMTSLASGLLASTYIQQDRLDEAAALLPDKISHDMLRTDYARLRAAVELRLTRDEPHQVLKVLDRLDVPQRANWRGAMAYYYGTILYLRGETLLRLQYLPQARTTLQDLLDLYQQNGIGMGRWRILILLGRLQRAAGDHRQATATFEAARAGIAQLAGTVSDQDLRQKFLRQAQGMVPSALSLTPRQATKLRYDGLTRREREVAAVVARGLSNQEIADELVISIKTVEAHITRILSKLDFSSRAQIAAWAVKKDLTSS